MPDYANNLTHYFRFIMELKTVKRSGWVKKLGVLNPESVADHSFGMAAIGVILAEYLGLDVLRVLKMILIHDLAESVTGDFIPDEISKIEKTELEKAAMDKILFYLPQSQKAQYFQIWQEYIENKTDVANFVHRIDKLEMAMQASMYLKLGYDKRATGEFFRSATKSLDMHNTDILWEIINAIKGYSR